MIVLKLPLEEKKVLIGNIQAYFETERGETIGDLAADSVLEFMIKELGPVIYNQALRDARSVVAAQVERIEEEIYALEQPKVRAR